MLSPFLAGLGLGLSLIVAIGAQNLFVLRQGIRREHAVAVALVCALSDAALIAVGVSGLGVLLHAAPWLIDAVRWAGAAFLAVYALIAARRALRGNGETLDAAAPAVASDAPITATPLAGAGSPRSTATRPRAASRLAPVLLTCLALTWLNPHVYLDTVFLLGSVAATHGDTRWVFAAGAVVASFGWFFALALGARSLSRWLATPRAWRILDGVIAVVMLAIAVNLVWPH
ncbi:MAG: amino acid transporter [Microbacterium sp.]|uniref:LysE/ArgO family amino acid transporter n=1 Tax=Microbacterium sp. TaxID=51671 RepID=UPI001AD5259B|nr:LysE/ArgO family amino acid transporter [Microbacterium sp.]MBN9177962.1 amino acid transporter [Microbacterium sp.]